MELRVMRNQKSARMLSRSVIFELVAKMHLTPEEADNIRKYKLGNEVIYNSEASRKHLDNARSSGPSLGDIASLALSKLSLNITVDSLTSGQSIECKSLDEVLGAEEALRTACENVKTYLDVAARFNGEVEIFEF